jgi:hypothetical protein
VRHEPPGDPGSTPALNSIITGFKYLDSSEHWLAYMAHLRLSVCGERSFIHMGASDKSFKLQLAVKVAFILTSPAFAQSEKLCGFSQKIHNKFLRGAQWSPHGQTE